MSKLKKIFIYVLTSIQLVTNFGYITIEKVTKRDLETLNGVILNLILMNTFINFIAMTNNSSELLENWLARQKSLGKSFNLKNLNFVVLF